MGSFSDLANNNQNGFSMLAVRSSPDDVAKVLEGLADTTGYHRATAIGEVVIDAAHGSLRNLDGSHLEITARSDRRTAFLVRSIGSDWCVLFRTLEWVELEDINWVDDVAKLLSKSLETQAISVAGNWECNFRRFDNGKAIKKLNGADPDKVAPLIDDLNIAIPHCMIAGDPPRLFATKDEAETIEDAHEIQLTVS